MKHALLLMTVMGARVLGAEPLVLTDARGDENGPGSYVPPTGSEYRRGDFDLRRFSVRVDGQHAVLEVTLGAPIRDELVRQRTNASDLALDNGIYLQHVDIYVDHTPGNGFTSALPGRRVAFSPEEAWDVAITLTPLPGPTRTVLQDWNKDAAEKVLTPGPLRSRGPTLTARVPLWQLGGAPKVTWGWSVMVSGAAWVHSFAAFQRLRGTHDPDAFTLPVVAIPEDSAFGGATLGGNHPYVIDVLLPEGATQSKVLGTFAAGKPAVVPMVYRERPVRSVAAPPSKAADAGAQETADAQRPKSPGEATVSEEARPSEAARRSSGLVLTPRPSAPVEENATSGVLELEIANVQGEAVVIPAPEGGVKAWQIGEVVDREGRHVGRVVITQVSQGFALGTLTEGKTRAEVGHRVRFPRSVPAK